MANLIRLWAIVIIAFLAGIAMTLSTIETVLYLQGKGIEHCGLALLGVFIAVFGINAIRGTISRILTS